MQKLSPPCADIATVDSNPLESLQRFHPTELGRFANGAANHAAAEAVAQLGYGVPPEPGRAPVLLGGTSDEAAQAEVVMLVGVVLRLTDRIRANLAQRPAQVETAAAMATLYRVDAALTAVAEAACSPVRTADGPGTVGSPVTMGGTVQRRRGRHLAVVGAG